MTKTIFITGSTDGIGKHLALKLAMEGHTIILHGRNFRKLQTTKSYIRNQVPNAKLHSYLADLSKMTDIYNLTDQIKRDFEKLDVLFNNAGLFAGKVRKLTEEGVELTFMLSVLAPYILTTELLPLLEKSDAGRVINTSSFMHHFAKVKGLDFALENGYNPSLAYNNAKLYTIWLTRFQAMELEKRGSKVTINSYHPGLISTNLGNDSSDSETQKSLFAKIMKGLSKDLDGGIVTGYYLTLSDQVKGVSGRYFDDKKEKWVSKKGYNVEKAKQLMKYCHAAIERRI